MRASSNFFPPIRAYAFRFPWPPFARTRFRKGCFRCTRHVRVPRDATTLITRIYAARGYVHSRKPTDVFECLHDRSLCRNVSRLATRTTRMGSHADEYDARRYTRHETRRPRSQRPGNLHNTRVRVGTVIVIDNIIVVVHTYSFAVHGRPERVRVRKACRAGFEKTMFLCVSIICSL